MTAKHRRPRTTGRKIAATAAVLTAGALPLAGAGSAFADGAAPAALTALPTLPTVPLPALDAVLPVAQGALADQNPTMQVRDALEQGLAGQVGPALLRDGTVGTLARGFGRPATAAAGGVVTRVQPVVRRLHGQGVPTVGEVTAELSRTRMPVFGTVGNLTSAVPVSTVLGQDSPVIGALGVAGGL